jgi:ATP-dependent DNA helicase DinG
VRVALLKGRSNYLCLHRLELAEQQATMRVLDAEVAAVLPRVRQWAQVTASGEIAELAQLGEAAAVWPWVTSTRENCLGAQCPRFERCHLVQARRVAQGADVVVVNHHLLLADLVLKETGWGDLLPGVQAVIVDEAHQLADVAGMFLGFAVSTRQAQALCKDLLAERSSGAVMLERAPVELLADRVAAVQETFARATPRWEFDAWPDTAIESLEQLRHALAALTVLLDASLQQGAAAAALQRRTAELQHHLALLLETTGTEEAGVRWAQASGGHVAWHFAPVDVAGQLGALIEAQAGAWICASATLSVAGDFTHFLSRVGISDAAVAEFGSPFDYGTQALLYLPPDLDPPAAPSHTHQVIQAALPVLQASGGRAFLLFTSHRALREAAELLEQLRVQLNFPLLVQGTVPREVLLRRFRELGNAVLLGTSSFWEGVDVQGTALSVVVIDKLPFAVPEDPVLKARLAAIERRGGNPFLEEQLPQAVLALKQGVGRLLRAPEDFGVIMLCDQRLRSRGYGRVFLDSLPPMQRTEQLAEVRSFLRDKFAEAGIDPAAARKVSG